MSRTHRRDMPPYAKVRSEYVRGMSWTQLGKKYGVNPRSLYGFMKRDAQNAGHDWPLRATTQRSREAQLDAYDRCPAIGLRLELREFRAWSGIDYKTIAREAGLNKTTLHKITAGLKTTVTVETRDKVMAVILRHEEELKSKKQSAA